MVKIESVLYERMRALGPEAYKKFLCKEMIYHWNEIVDASIADKVEPVTIECGVLFVEVTNSAFKDQLKFFAEEIIDAVNEYLAEEKMLVKEIRIAQGFQVAENPRPKKIKPVEEPKPQVAQIPLTDEELKRCEERAAKISDEALRKTVFDTLVSQVRVQKFRLSNGWHKCAACEVLCPPEETFCEVCRIKNQEIMFNELYKIIYDKPWLNARDVEKILLERMPNMRGECSFDVVESARTSLIQKVASAIRYGDEDSADVYKLVMLEKRLPPDKLTPTIIRRTLFDLKFNLADQALLLYNPRKKNRKR